MLALAFTAFQLSDSYTDLGPLRFHFRSSLRLVRSDFLGRLGPLPQVGLVEQGKARPVKQISELHGRVRITSNAGALDFVRLLTSPVTRLGSGTWMEVMPSNKYKGQLSFGWAEYLPDSYLDGVYGAVSGTWMEKHRISEARVHRKGNQWVVERWIADDSWDSKVNPKELVLIQELVGKDGSYTRREVRHKALPKPEVLFLIPRRL